MPPLNRARSALRNLYFEKADLRNYYFEKAALRFSLRTTCASILALWIGFVFHLDSPHWAAITVWVVAQPSRGMTLSKSFYRFLGTCLGASVAIFMIMFLAQTPVLFLLFLAGWNALCCAGANLVRYFRSYGAVLAGFTASIIGLLVFDHPDQVWEVARARVICILLGITVMSLVTSFLSPGKAKIELFAKIREVMSDTIAWCSRIVDQAPRGQISELERRLVVNIGRIDELTSYAVAESLQIRMRRRRIHGLIASLFSLISSARALDIYLAKQPELLDTMKAELKELASLLEQIAIEFKRGEAHATERSTELRNRFLRLVENLDPGSETVSVPRQVLKDRIEGLASTMIRTVANVRDLMNAKPPPSGPQLHFHRDTKHATRVGLRAFLAVMIAGGIWLLTGWPGGSLFVMMTAVNCGVFATSADPRSGLITSFKASLLSIVMAMMCFFVFHPETHSPGVLFLILALFLIPGGIVAASPRMASAGALFNINFLVFLAPAHPMAPFHALHFANVAMGFFGAVLLTLIMFYAVFPANGQKRVKALSEDIARDLARVANAKTIMRATEWETLMYNRVSRLLQVSAETGYYKQELIDGSLGALDIGREILRLQNLLTTNQVQGETAVVLRKCLQSLTRLAQAPDQVAKDVREQADYLNSQMTHLSTRFHKRAAGALLEISDGISAHRTFFHVPR